MLRLPAPASSHFFAAPARQLTALAPPPLRARSAQAIEATARAVSALDET